MTELTKNPVNNLPYLYRNLCFDENWSVQNAQGPCLRAVVSNSKYGTALESCYSTIRHKLVYKDLLH